MLKSGEQTLVTVVCHQDRKHSSKDYEDTVPILTLPCTGPAAGRINLNPRLRVSQVSVSMLTSGNSVFVLDAVRSQCHSGQKGLILCLVEGKVSGTNSFVYVCLTHDTL